jgi:hypothetical protein
MKPVPGAFVLPAMVLSCSPGTLLRQCIQHEARDVGTLSLLNCQLHAQQGVLYHQRYWDAASQQLRV